MAFLYVDRITAYEPRRHLHGLKNVTRSEPYLTPGPDGRKVAHPMLLLEALAQLSAWLALLDHDFSKRPLFLGEDAATLDGPVLSGDQVDLRVELIRYSDDVVETRGAAAVRGRTVLTSECSRGYLVPMESLDDGARVRKRFAELHRPNQKHGPTVAGLPDPSYAPFWRTSRRRPLDLVDGVGVFVPLKEIETVKNVAATESFFAEHFARRPVVPGVVLMAMVLDAAEMLTYRAPAALGEVRRLRLEGVRNVRFRQMVEPGDQCVVKAKVQAWDAAARRLDLTAAVYVGTRRVTQMEMRLGALGALPAERADAAAS